jgi:tRNA threonylcarbamoyladenosine biosynthesis protein TsaB
MATLALNSFERKEFQDVAYYEPYYLKDFIAGKPGKNMLERLI